MAYPNKSQLAFILNHPAVADVENEGMDEGRFFVHLKPGYDWCIDPSEVRTTQSFSTAARVYICLKRVKATS